MRTLILNLIPFRYERSWGVFFESFEEFLTFSWPVITVTDCATGKAHIVTRMTSIGAFLKMIKTRQAASPRWWPLCSAAHNTLVTAKIRRDTPAGGEYTTRHPL